MNQSMPFPFQFNNNISANSLLLIALINQVNQLHYTIATRVDWYLYEDVWPTQCGDGWPVNCPFLS